MLSNQQWKTSGTDLADFMNTWKQLRNQATKVVVYYIELDYMDGDNLAGVPFDDETIVYVGSKETIDKLKEQTDSRFVNFVPFDYGEFIKSKKRMKPLWIGDVDFGWEPSYIRTI